MEENPHAHCTHTGVCYHSESDGDDRGEFDEEDEDEPFAQLFQKVCLLCDVFVIADLTNFLRLDVIAGRLFKECFKGSQLGAFCP